MALVLLIAGPSAPAQLGSTPGLSTGLLKLFGNTTAFTAKVDVQVLDKTGREALRMPITFAVLDGKIRVETDFNQVKTPDLTASALAELKRDRMDRVTSLLRPDERLIHVLYPAASAYVDFPITKEDAEAATGATLRVERTPLVQETIDRHPAVKNQVLVKDAKGATVLEATTWNAADLKDFPVRISMKENNLVTVMNFRQIEFARPAANLFQPPAGYAKYVSPQALQYAVTQKSKGGKKK